jgi:hypothetical protein
MKRFTYYTGGASANQSDPILPQEYYNYMKGKWRYGDDMIYGGSGFPGTKGSTNIHSDYMFPEDSDTLNWSTEGIDPGSKKWDEKTNGNVPGDRRFVQSAGSFTLRPGSVNNITVGIIWARSNEGDRSISALKRADTKIQSFFNSCFEVYDGKNFRNDIDLKKLSINEKKNNISISVYPNPSSDFFKINCPKKDDYTISIFNSEGRNVYDQKYFNQNEMTVNTENIKEGIYTVVIYNENTKISKKISVIH